MANFISKEEIISWATNAQGNVFPITLKETLDIHYKHEEKEEKRKELREMRNRYPLKQGYEKDAYGCHFKDITEEIIRNSDSVEGSIRFEKLRGEFSAKDVRAWMKVNSHNGDEMADAIWLRNYLGGDITILADRSREKALVADYFWRSYLWERKEVWGKKFR